MDREAQKASGLPSRKKVPMSEVCWVLMGLCLRECAVLVGLRLPIRLFIHPQCRNLNHERPQPIREGLGGILFWFSCE